MPGPARSRSRSSSACTEARTVAHRAPGRPQLGVLRDAFDVQVHRVGNAGVDGQVRRWLQRRRRLDGVQRVHQHVACGVPRRPRGERRRGRAGHRLPTTRASGRCRAGRLCPAGRLRDVREAEPGWASRSACRSSLPAARARVGGSPTVGRPAPRTSPPRPGSRPGRRGSTQRSTCSSRREAPSELDLEPGRVAVEHVYRAGALSPWRTRGTAGPRRQRSSSCSASASNRFGASTSMAASTATMVSADTSTVRPRKSTYSVMTP